MNVIKFTSKVKIKIFKNYDSLPKTLVTDHTNYQDYYNSSTRELVTNMFQEEIEILGYKF